MNKNKLLPALIAGLVIALAWVTLVWNPQSAEPHSLANSPEISQAPTGGEFSVNTADGKFNLSDYKDKVVALYFGYTLCPDVCPTSLGFTAAALRQLTDEELSGIQTLFISVDPDRDDVRHLKDYAQYFHPSMIGGTDSREVIDKIVKQYGASYRFVETESSLKYLVDHSSTIYLIDKTGALSQTITHGTLPSEIAVALREELGK